MLENNKNAVTVIYSGGDIQVPFLFYDQDDLVVLYEITPKALGTDYTVTGAGNEVGGKVTLVTQPEDGTRVTVIRKVDFTQLLQIPANGIIPEGALNRALDRIVMMVQQLEERADRAVEYPEGTDKNDVANAQNILDSIEEGQQTITNAVQVAEATLEASNAALVASNKALNDAEVKRVLVNQNGDTQVERILTEGNKQDSRVETEGNEQTTRVTNEGDKQYQRVRTLGDSKYSDLNTKHQAAVSEITELRDSSVALVDQHKVEGVASVEAAEEAAMRRVSDMPEYLPNYETIMHDQMGQRIAGEVAGTSGKWKFEGIYHVEAVNPNYTVGRWGEYRTYVGCSTGNGDKPSFGSTLEILVNEYGLIFGNSGKFYLVYASAGGNVRVHPYHGDVSGDFSIGSTYPLYHFRESSDFADRQTGDRNVLDHFCGGAMHSMGGILMTTGQVAAFVDTPSGNNISATVVVDHVYDATGVKLLVDVDNGQEVNLVNEAMVYDDVNHRLTWSGVINATSGTWSNLLFKIVGADTGYISDEAGGDATVLTYTAGATTRTVSYNGIANYCHTHAEVTESRTAVQSVEKLTGEFSVGDYGTLNTGYWNGTEWVSNFLSDVPVSAGRVVLKLDSKFKTVGKIKARAKDGTWHTLIYGDSTVAKGWTVSSLSNAVYINIADSYGVLGYGSMAEMLDQTLITVEYVSRARVWRPIEMPREFVALSSKVYFLCTNQISSGACMVSDLIDYVPTQTDSLNVNWTVLERGADIFRVSPLRVAPVGYHNYIPFNPRYVEPRSVVFMHGLYKEGGTLRMAVMFKELVHSGEDWGDNNRFDTIDFITTTTDEHGKVVTCGTVVSDTQLRA